MHDAGPETVIGDAAEVGPDKGWDQGPDDRRPGGPRAWWGWTAVALSVAGFGDSLYLTLDHFRGTVPICAASGIVDCAKVTTSAESEVFGVLPVALLGLLFFTAMTAVNVPPLWRRGGALGLWAARGRLALAVTGMGMVVYLLYAELFSIKAICLWCTGVHIVTFLLFVLVVATYPTVAQVGEPEEP